ncbi:hypothetical protein Ancab_035769 [Ancistrocladus abbreviatus]
MIIADGNSNGDTACRNADENRSIAKSLISKLNLAAESEIYASRDDSQISKGNGATTAISQTQLRCNDMLCQWSMETDCFPKSDEEMAALTVPWPWFYNNEWFPA